MRFRLRSFRSFFQEWLTAARRPKSRRVRLTLECLEDRVALSTIPAPTNAWAAIGPAPMVGNTSYGGTVTGRVTSIAVDPADKTGSTVFIGTAGGGVWEGTG